MDALRIVRDDSDPYSSVATDITHVSSATGASHSHLHPHCAIFSSAWLETYARSCMYAPFHSDHGVDLLDTQDELSHVHAA